MWQNQGLRVLGQTRSASQAAAAAQHAKKLQDKLPAGAIEVWTDGSSIGNPGPSGAGVIIKITKQPSICENSYALGTSTNQASELWAIGGALETIVQDTNTFPGNAIHVFSDSQFAINCTTGKFHSTKLFSLVDTMYCTRALTRAQTAGEKSYLPSMSLLLGMLI